MIEAILAGLRAALTGDSALMAALGGARVYSLMAPDSATLPYLVLRIEAGGAANRTPVSEADVTVSVICVGDDSADGAAVAVACADRVRAVLHDAPLALGGGWSAYRCQHRAVVLFSETEDRRTYTHAGGTYRVRAYRDGSARGDDSNQED